MHRRWLFFSLFCAMAMPGRFQALFYAAHGQSDGQVGALIAVSTAVAVVANPLLSNLADRTRRRERVAAATYALAVATFLIQIVAWPSLELVAPRNTFLVLLALRVLIGFCEAAAYPLVCAIAIDQLRDEFGEKGHRRFGTERLWGAVGWAICALGLGYVLDIKGVGMWAVHVGVAVFGSAHVVALLMFERTKMNKEEVPHERHMLLAPDMEDALVQGGLQSENDHAAEEGLQEEDNDRPRSMAALPAIYRILTAGGLSTVLYFNMFFWLSIGMSLVENLLFLFFKNDLHATNFVCGLSVVVTVVFELPLFAMAPKLLRRVGAPALAVIGCIAYVVRGFGYTIAPNGWVVLLFEPLHGVTFAAIETATVAFVAERTPKELVATGQAVAAGLRTTAFTVGTSVGGWVMQRYGSRVVYRMGGLLVLMAVAAFVWANRLGNGAKRLQGVPRNSAIPEQTSRYGAIA